MRGMPRQLIRGKKMTHKSKQYKKALLEALEKSLGVVTTACKAVSLSRKTFYTYYHEDGEFRRAVDDIENIALDFAESQLHKQIQNGEVTSTIFFLKTKGKKRGYVETKEITGKDGAAQEHKITVEFIDASNPNTPTD